MHDFYDFEPNILKVTDNQIFKTLTRYKIENVQVFVSRYIIRPDSLFWPTQEHEQPQISLHPSIVACEFLNASSIDRVVPPTELRDRKISSRLNRSIEEENGRGGAAAVQAADRGVPGGLQPLRQRWRRDDHEQGAWHGDAFAGAEPVGGGAAGYGEGGGRRRQRRHRFPGVPDPPGAPDAGGQRRRRGRAPRGLPRLRPGPERLHLPRRARPRPPEPRRAPLRRRARRDAPRGRRRRRRTDQLHRVRQGHAGQAKEPGVGRPWERLISLQELLSLMYNPLKPTLPPSFLADS